MSEYQTVVLDRNEVPKLPDGSYPTWVTQINNDSGLVFWGNPRPEFQDGHKWGETRKWVETRGLPWNQWVRERASDYPEVCEAFDGLFPEQRIARIEYHLKPEPCIDGEPDPDPVNHPPHYTQGEIECIDSVRAALTPEEFRGHCKGNAMEYIWREKHKNGDEDIRKAIRNLEAILGASK